MQVTLKIQRFNPETDPKPHWEEYQVEVDPTDRLLDALNQVKWFQDGTLAFRRSCGHGVCGSDAMTINSVNRLACKVLMQDLSTRVTVEPLRGFPVIKDLVVDMEPLFEN
jgi:succinate dehydrogenase / fumarate reductase iron-sulfur subunit